VEDSRSREDRDRVHRFTGDPAQEHVDGCRSEGVEIDIHARQ
jgi:hypothetical protein